MNIAILGTRGIPASYGGFETFAEELSWRLVERGHRITVYCRSHYTPRQMRSHRGIRLVVLPTIRHKYLDTVMHSFLCAIHTLGQNYDAVLVCNAANSIFVPFIRLSGAAVAVNVDGVERKRKKWNRVGQSYYHFSERVACRVADALVSDARVIQAYYRDTYRKGSHFIPYGASTEKTDSREALERFGLEPGKYWLYVSRFEPENNAHYVLEAFHRLGCYDFRLVMVGDAPYAGAYVRRLKEMAGDNVVFTGYVYGRGYRELVSHAYGYVQATEVGGTHPALIESMGMGNGVLAADTPENREVAGDAALLFSLSDPQDLTSKMRMAIEDRTLLPRLAERGRRRVRETYNWERVTDSYEKLFDALARKDLAALELDMSEVDP